MSASVDHAQQLLQRGQAKAAFDLLARAAAGSDAQAALFLADLRLSGQVIRRDLGEAREWFGRAAALGLKEAEPVFTAMLANGAGGSARHWQDARRRLAESSARDPWARRQADLLAAMALTADGDPLTLPPSTSLSDDPQIRTIPALLTRAECRYLVERADELMQPATVVDSRTGRVVRDPIRSASAASFPFVMEDPAVHAINRRISSASGTTYQQGEPLQVLRYRPGERYRLHSDALRPGGEQRILTVLVALGGDFAGGETSFPRLGLNWRGQPGDALVFANVDGVGAPDPRVWHEGKPVTRGIKHLLSKWIRGGPLDLSGPPGRPL